MMISYAPQTTRILRPNASSSSSSSSHQKSSVYLSARHSSSFFASCSFAAKKSSPSGKSSSKCSLKVHAFQLGSVDQDELNAPKIDISLTRVKKGVKIGEGAFGSVFLGELKDETKKGGKTTTTRVVLKSMNKKMGRDVDSFYQDELNVLNRLKNNDGAAPL